MIRKTLARSDFLKAVYHIALAQSRRIAYRISPVLLARFRYQAAWGKWPDLDSPQTFDEKLLWLMLNWHDPLIKQCTDKYAKGNYVKQQGLDHILPKVYGVYQSVEEIEFNALPNRFVLKCTHGCKANVFCKDKATFDVQKAKRLLSGWLKTDFSTILGDLHYAGIPPRIMCEEYLEEPGATLPTDYKIHCFNGRAAVTLICTERAPNGAPRLQFYDREWNNRLPYILPEIHARHPAPKPIAYAEMLSLAESLAKPFPFVRVDFYYIRSRILLGELTFTPGGCLNADYLNNAAQKELGELLVLPQKRPEAFKK